MLQNTGRRWNGSKRPGNTGCGGRSYGTGLYMPECPAVGALFLYRGKVYSKRLCQVTLWHGPITCADKRGKAWNGRSGPSLQRKKPGRRGDGGASTVTSSALVPVLGYLYFDVREIQMFAEIKQWLLGFCFFGLVCAVCMLMFPDNLEL